MWAKYAIYEAIDKIPGICRDMDLMWSKMEHYGFKWGIAQLHVYLNTYI